MDEIHLNTSESPDSDCIHYQHHVNIHVFKFAFSYVHGAKAVPIMSVGVGVYMYYGKSNHQKSGKIDRWQQEQGMCESVRRNFDQIFAINDSHNKKW